MKSKNLILLIAITFGQISISSAAGLDLGSLTIDSVGTATLQSAPGRTKYQTLIEAYQGTTQPAQLSDFQNKNLKCLLVAEDNPDTLMPTGTTLACNNIVVPAQPAYDIPYAAAQGPLFPGQPARHVPAQAAVCASGTSYTLVMGQEWINTIDLKQLKVFSNQQSSSDLVIKVAKNNQDIYSDLGGNVEILLRHQDNYIPFIVHTDKGIVYAGYCY